MIRSIHKMTVGEEEPSVWESTPRVIVMEVKEKKVVLGLDLPSMKIQDKAVIPVPNVDVFPGTRALEQWSMIFSLSVRKERTV